MWLNLTVQTNYRFTGQAEWFNRMEYLTPSSWVWGALCFAEGPHWGMGGAKDKVPHSNRVVPPTK